MDDEYSSGGHKARGTRAFNAHASWCENSWGARSGNVLGSAVAARSHGRNGCCHAEDVRHTRARARAAAEEWPAGRRSGVLTSWLTRQDWQNSALYLDSIAAVNFRYPSPCLIAKMCRVTVSLSLCFVVLGGVIFSVLVTGSKFRGFRSGQGQWILRAIKIRYRSVTSVAEILCWLNSTTFLSAPTFATRCLSCNQRVLVNE
jgi:hypothetical protein